jgi:hypothetical protein
VLLAGSLSAACASQPAPAEEPPAPALWGELKPVVTVKQLMDDLIDPASDLIFNAVGTVISDKGIVETEPRTDDDWAKIRVGAVTMAEGIYLLKIPRPIAPPGDLNHRVGPDASELTPDQIKARIEADTVLWNAKIEALRNINLQVLDIVKRKAAKELSEAGEILEEACESCHLEYWYPAEKGLMKRLDRRLKGQ